jgi:hypothetical protein
VTTEWYPFVKFLVRSGHLFFNDIRGWLKINSDFLMVGSATFLPRKTFLLGATPRHK